MTLPKVSIIIPVWGVEQYVEACVRSVIMQNYTGVLECVIINDCTPDGSMEVVERVVKDYEGNIDFRIFSHEKNRGLSAARNTGMAVATGDYIFFLDSDDEVTPNCISSLTAPLVSKPYDMVIGDIKELNTERDMRWLSLPEGEMLSSQQIRAAYLEWKWYPMAPNKLYRKTFVEQYALNFKEGLIHEDELWTAKIAFLLENMYVVSQKTYLYKIRENSIMTSLDAQKDIDAVCDVMKELGIFFKQYRLNKNPVANGLMIRLFCGTIEKQREKGLCFKEVYQQSRRSMSINKKTVFLQPGCNLFGMLINSHLLFPPSFAKYYYPLVQKFIKSCIIVKGYLCSKYKELHSQE